MDVKEAKDILSQLTPEVRAERQRIVDAAVREARRAGYCETFDSIMSRVFPEMCIEINGYTVALDSEGRCCSSGNQTVWEYLNEEGDESEIFGEDGYNRYGIDRDGFDRFGYNDGFDADGFSRSRSHDTRVTTWVDEDGTARSETERWYRTGYGYGTARDAAGNLRPGRPATPEEQAAAAMKAAAATERFNPTTWSPSED